MGETLRKREPLHFLVVPLVEGATSQGGFPVAAANYREAAAIAANALGLPPGEHRLIVQSVASGEEMVVQLFGEESIVWAVQSIRFLPHLHAMH